MQESLTNKIQRYLKSWSVYKPDYWVNGGEIERLAQEKGYKSSNASRRCREMAVEGIIERRENSRGHVEYRYKQSVMKIVHEGREYELV